MNLKLFWDLKFRYYLFSGNAGDCGGEGTTESGFLVGGRRKSLIGKSPRKSEGGPERLPVLSDTILASSIPEEVASANEVMSFPLPGDGREKVQS